MDSLTKTALWLIALALWGLLLRPLVLPTPPGAQGMMDVNIAAISGSSILTNSLDVNIREVSGNRIGGSIPVTQLPVTQE